MEPSLNHHPLPLKFFVFIGLARIKDTKSCLQCITGKIFSVNDLLARISVFGTSKTSESRDRWRVVGNLCHMGTIQTWKGAPFAWPRIATWVSLQ